MKQGNIQHSALKETGKYLSDVTRINCSIPVIKEMIKKVFCSVNDSSCYRNVNFVSGIPAEIAAKVEKSFNVKFVENEEGYVIVAEEDINVYSPSERGLKYGAETLIQLSCNGFFNEGIVYNYPVCKVRGVKVYLPAAKDIEYFKEFVDMVCYYRYNTIVIEVGGAMEYKRHPEINSGWVEYCKEMSEYSDKTKEIQEHTFKWRKNSIHVENGGGSYLNQDTVKELIAYCRERMLEVIPEIPSLSHCDYLLINHPEIKERVEDPYPDTYCPSNPKSYELLFDVLDEIVDVFKPNIVHVGHDEYYSIGLCDKCRDRKAEDIYSEDLIKIHDYLAGYGAKTMIWGEKLINAIGKKGQTYGGSQVVACNYDTGDFQLIIPATYKAIDLVPRDLMIMHWYWGIVESYEEEYLKRNLFTVYGNFSGPEFPHWKPRIRRGINGAVMSNWSSLKEENLQRNGFLFNLAYSSVMFWNNGYDDCMYNDVMDFAFKGLYDYKYRSIRNTCCQAGHGTSYIEVTHTANYNIDYKEFADGTFIDNEFYRLGDYVLVYEDGTEASIPVIYGLNISKKDVSWTRSMEEAHDVYKIDRLLTEVASTTLPVRIGDATYYKFTFRNPHPEKTVKSLKVREKEGRECSIFVKEINFR
jgi:hexosaminidase